MTGRRMSTVPALALALVGWAALAAGQEPGTSQRSGLLSRFIPIHTYLPHDRDRDDFYTTRWADKPAGKHLNNPCDGGLYGRPWPGGCTACAAPYFRGDPGRSTLGPGSAPRPQVVRRLENFVHPFKPVGTYYAGGCYVPIYDLDPTVPGPGPFPWPHFCKRPTGG